MRKLFRHVGLVVWVSCLICYPLSADDRVNKLLSGIEEYGLAAPFKYFAMPVDAEAPREAFRGRLILDMAAFSGGFQALYDRDKVATDAKNRVRDLPKFNFEFASVDRAIVPVERGIIETGHPYFDWVLSPGSVWQKTKRSVRMSIPFALMEKNANCIHNGVLLVDVDSSGRASRVLMQVGSETCIYLKFNFWASYEAVWQDSGAVEQDAIAAAYSTELAARLPRAPISKLTDSYPDFDTIALEQQNEISPVNMTAYGLVLNGQHYTANCMTRMGVYPHCDTMVLPSYSLAKSIAGGLGLMRLEKLYPGMFEVYVSDLIDACSSQNWEGVQLKHLLDMTTGNYKSSKAHGDEGAAHFLPFFTVTTSADKTAFSCKHFKNKSKPGKKWVYHTSDTYLLGVAMNAFLTKNNGEPIDYYSSQLVPLWQELGLSPLTHAMRTTTGPAPQPFTGYGMLLYRDDIARLAQSLTMPESSFRDNFSKAQLDAALQLDPDNYGKRAGVKNLRYKNGFWGWNAKKAAGCKTDTWVPFFSGFGGISVILLPGGNVYYYFSDGGVHAFSTAIKEISKITPICKVI